MKGTAGAFPIVVLVPSQVQSPAKSASAQSSPRYLGPRFLLTNSMAFISRCRLSKEYKKTPPATEVGGEEA
jgi:hypothetical protein